jgi:hypothetical protein
MNGPTTERPRLMPSSCTRPRFWAEVVSGMRTRWILRPCAFKAAIRIDYATGSVGSTERVYSRKAAQGRGLWGDLIWLANCR